MSDERREFLDPFVHELADAGFNSDQIKAILNTSLQITRFHIGNLIDVWIDTVKDFYNEGVKENENVLHGDAPDNIS